MSLISRDNRVTCRHRFVPASILVPARTIKIKTEIEEAERFAAVFRRTLVFHCKCATAEIKHCFSSVLLQLSFNCAGTNRFTNRKK